MKLCMMTYTMARQGCYKVKDFIKTAVDSKLEGIDWVTTYGHDPKELKKMSSDAGLKTACHTFSLGKFARRENGWLDDAKRSIQDAVELGAPVIMIPPSARQGEIDRNGSRSTWIEVLKQIVPLADDAGLILTLENLAGKFSPFITAADFFEAQKEIPQLKLTYDNGNAASGENPVDSFNKSADYAVHVHFKDWDIIDHNEEGFTEMSDGKYYRPALIGEGNINTVDCWNALKKYGYKGFINIEYENDKYPADQAIKKAAEYLRTL